MDTTIAVKLDYRQFHEKTRNPRRGESQGIYTYMPAIQVAKILEIESVGSRLLLYEYVLGYIAWCEKEAVRPAGICKCLPTAAGASFLDTPRTDFLFPELRKYMNFYTPIEFLNLLDGNKITNSWRAEVLKHCIEDCKAKVQEGKKNNEQ